MGRKRRWWSISILISIFGLVLLGWWWQRQQPAAVFLTQGFVGDLAFSPDGQILAYVEGETNGVTRQTVECWVTLRQVPDGRVLHTVEAKNVWNVAFSPDGRLLAFNNGSTVDLWLTEEQELFTTLRGDQTVADIAFSPDGELIATGGDDTVRIWRVHDSKLMATWTIEDLLGEPDAIRRVTFSPDGQSLVAAADGAVYVWDTHTEQQAEEIDDGIGNSISDLAFSPDGRYLVIGYGNGNSFELLRVGDWELLTPFQEHKSWSYSVAFSPDGTVVASASGARGYMEGPPKDPTIRLWSVPDGEQLRVIRAHQNPILALAFSPDGQWLASGSEDNTIKLWKMK